MKTSIFRIVPLRTEIAEAAREGLRAGAPDHALVTADSSRGYPCRHCLSWAQPGEKMILFPYAAIPQGRPYSEQGPIFVHAEACERYSATSEYPREFREGRVLRVYNSASKIVGAEVLNDDDPERVIEQLLENPDAAFLHARSVTHGCYTFEVQRQ